MSPVMRTALLPGSFDPPTAGHLDVVERARHLFDRVVVVVLHNPEKPSSGFLGVPERVEALRASVASGEAAGPGSVEVHAASGLLVDVAREHGADVVLKGIRGEGDWSYEQPMAVMNRQLSGIETVMLPCAPELAHISSTLVRQIAQGGGAVTELVPGPVEAAVRRALSAS
ncbi:Phosphopantetheine adenylyltransferase [Kytococcus aerolatus]|uniref:Phosphopantetheine adenylyltransferase n=2 Tax=Kytococcus aerolatus TaxID=592308 RepID=A0A212U1M6_9MICO|nr:Phosphopantetheine adenylyltransferase [Kytococcus aerolatus]